MAIASVGTEELYYALCDRRYDVVELADNTGAVQERVRYSAYGKAWVTRDGDADSSGAIDGGDLGILMGAWGSSYGDANFNPDVDLNNDGTIDGADMGILLGAWGSYDTSASGFGNTVMYAGYLYDAAAGLHLARFRWYDADRGRWVTRDPAEYIGASNMMEYVESSPMNFVDPSGLIWLQPTLEELFEGKPWSMPPARLTPQEQEKEKTRRRNAKTCRDWAKKQKKRGNGWTANLPNCPCSLDKNGKPNDGSPAPGGGCTEWEVDPSDDWEDYHPKGDKQIRSTDPETGHGQQCVYSIQPDGSYRLITGGESAGTPDYVSPSIPSQDGYVDPGYYLGTWGGTVLKHMREDVTPFVACRDADMLDTYHKYRKPNNVRKCPGNQLD